MRLVYKSPGVILQSFLNMSVTFRNGVVFTFVGSPVAHLSAHCSATPSYTSVESLSLRIR